ncbi:ShlB/FhaC/HecB family hemolysin secretion/activation protein [Isoalcanivorax beigongshangi]|uniref:ShlB/FhaC/HecB family hemolysin secretion/activation protein n=1 Tax=Isoalcanivorax beigongshangi TaxID=3238810 RepID=A0ABV4ACW0_9GAMM
MTAATRTRRFGAHGIFASALMLALAAPALAAEQADVSDDAAHIDTATVTVREYLVRGNTVLTVREIQDTVYPFLGEQRTLADIDAAREALQQRYEAAGYQSVFVDLPEQAVTGGVVLLVVNETRIGRVRVEDATHTSPQAIRDQVPALTEGSVPNFQAVQQELGAVAQRLRPVAPVVREGQLPGTMDVTLQVDDQRPSYGSLAFNNDYSADTTHYRAVVTVGHRNLWQKGHDASLTFFTAPEDLDDAKVWTGSYLAPLGGNWSLRANAFKSDSDVATVGGTTVVGRGTAYGATLLYSWPFQNRWLHSVSAGMEFKSFREALGMAGVDAQRYPIKYAPLSLGYTGYRFGDKSQSDLHLTVVTGFAEFFGYGSSDEEFNDKRHRARPSFTLLKAGASHTHNLTESGWQLHGTGSVQLATGPLISNEQMSAGGATSVRGYLSAESTGDTGGLLSAELRTPTLSGWLGPDLNDWRFYLFADSARLELLKPLPEQRWVHRLASAGVGTRAQMYDWLSWGLDLAWPLRDGANTERYDPHVHFNVRATF